MHVGTDLQSFIFKAPSYGRIGGAGQSITTPLTRISTENRLRIAVNELSLTGLSNIKRGLVILQSDNNYINYQTGLNHNYSSYGDADHAINLCPDFDISNILLKNFDTVVGTQSISTNFIIGNSIVPYNLTVFGNSILNGNVGIGTTSQLFSLDVSGSTRIVGPLVSTNYDTLRFSTNYGQQFKNNLNKATIDSYYQDCAISYDGQFQYGLLYNKRSIA
jgi:hypothetical protein